VGQYLRDLGSAVEVEAHDGQRGTELATGRHGGHGSASPFPVKGRRTGGANARTSTRGKGDSVSILGSDEEVAVRAIDDEAELGWRR
jgi:hypothetical protein